MSATRPTSERRARSGRPPARTAMFAALAALSVAVLPAPAGAAPGQVELKTVYASPVDASPTGDSTRDQRVLCTPEPSGRRIYGTQAPFDSTKFTNNPSGLGQGWPASTQNADPADNYPQSGTPTPSPTNPTYVPANMPSRDSLAPALQAGATNDLCFGFTLTPNVQPDFIKGPSNSNGVRLQDDPKAPDVDDTHVSTDVDGFASSNDGDDLKNIAIDMPTGFLGDPDGGTICTDAQLKLGTYEPAACPAASQVGTAYVRLSTWLSPTLRQHLAVGGAPNSIGLGLLDGGYVYNLEHGPNELGRLGLELQPINGVAPVKLVIRLLFTPDGSGRIRTVVQDVPRRIYLTSEIDSATKQPKAGARQQPLYVESVGVRAWGSKAEHPVLSSDFAQWGTDCSSPLSAKAAVNTYKGVRSEMESPAFQLTGCDALPFLPSVDVSTTEKRPGVPTAATVKVGLGQTTSGPQSALLKDASVTLPQGLELGAQVGARDGGLKLCSAAQFGAKNGNASACPAEAAVGDLTIVTPLQDRALTGKVYLGEQSAVGELPALYLEATPEGATAADAPRIKLVGKATAGENGQVTTTFKDAPQLRFSELKIDFSGGPNALFITPRSCGTTSGTSQFTSSASATPVAVTTSLTIDQDCDPVGFSPSFGMVSADPTAGAKSPTTIVIARNDRSPWLTGVKVALPSGFLADLNVASECAAASAAVGACPESSRMGTVTTEAGAGGRPLTLGGAIYLTERGEGAVAGAVIVVRAKIGDLDLGDVVVPARIDLRPTDAGLTLTTTAPTRFKNIALNLRSIAVALDRPNFALNPTACGPLRATADLTADGGQSASAAVDVAYTGCAARGFQPALTATLTGDLKPKGHPEINVTMKTRPGDSNLKSASVMLPDGVVADLPNVQQTCAPEAFTAGACPASNRVGSATARVSITSEVITGDVYLVKVAGATLPGLGLSFTGRYTQRVLSKVRIDGKTGRVITQFDAIPDLPITQLDLKVDGNAKSPIVISKACTADSSWDATFGGQGGQTATAKVLAPCGVAPKPGLKWSKKKGLTLSVSAAGGTTIRSAKLTMPSGFTVRTGKSSKAKKALKANVKFKATGGKIKSKVSSKSLSATSSGAGPKTITFTVKPKGYSVSKKTAKSFKKGKKLKVKVRVVGSNGKVSSSTVTVKVS